MKKGKLPPRLQEVELENVIPVKREKRLRQQGVMVRYKCERTYGGFVVLYDLHKLRPLAIPEDEYARLKEAGFCMRWAICWEPSEDSTLGPHYLKHVTYDKALNLARFWAGRGTIPADFGPRDYAIQTIERGDWK